MPLLPPTSPTCPLCESSDVKFVRQFDTIPEAFGGTGQPPSSTVFIFECACGCSFAVTVPIPVLHDSTSEAQAAISSAARQAR